jgi:hypothetical protein
MVAVPQTPQGEVFMLKRVGLLFVLLTMVVLATGTVHAAPRAAGPRPASESGGVLDRVWGWFSALLHTGPADNHTRVVWDAEGSHWDPNGNH